MRNRRRTAGFTLIELAIALVVLGILVAVALPRFQNVSRQAKEAEAPLILKQIFTLQQRYHTRYDRYAATIGELEGGEENVRLAKYYEFIMRTTATGFVVCAVPMTNMSLATFQIDETRTVRSPAPDCAASRASTP